MQIAYICSISFAFHKVFTYQPYKKRPEVTRSDVKNINTITRRGCAMDANEQYIINVVIPPTIPTDTTSSICKLEYALIVRLVFAKKKEAILYTIS